MQEYDWQWCANEIEFKPSYAVHKPEFGRQAHAYMSPYWMFELSVPPKDPDQRRAIESFLAQTEGQAVVNIHDPRVPVPAYYEKAFKQGFSNLQIPSLIIKGTDVATSALMISGQAGDRIHRGDPLAFTHNDRRYYFKSAEDLTLDGQDQSLTVFIRPRENLTGLNVTADRLRPTARFLININETGGRTSLSGFTAFKLSGVEFWGTVP